MDVDALLYMSEHNGSQQPTPLDELVTELLECGGVLSQIVGSMVKFEAAGLSAPDTAPIPEVAHSLIVSVLREVRRGYSRRDLRVAARIVHEATKAICENIYAVDPEWIRAMDAEDGTA